MIVGASMPYQSPVATTLRADDIRRTDNTADKTNQTDQPTDTTAAQFAQLMALLGDANSKVRTDLLKQVPAADSSLLDKLLSGATTTDTDATVAAARYGMLLGKSTTDLSALVGTVPVAAATSQATGASRISAEVLARIASRKSGSVEDLLALGDKDGASAKAKLDALLATAGTSDAATIAAANALVVALAASASNIATPIASTEGLDPAFRAKLEAVIARMKNETGSDVTVVETVRSQDRQNMLYAQGRTSPGDVVTWTQDSAHTRGQAADVIVDGRWNNPNGFALLQQIAKEEGLKTLGAADPGHLELTADAKQPAAATILQTVESSGVARVASVASVAQVATLGNATVTSIKTAPPAATTNNAPIGIMAQATRSSDSRSSSSQDKSSRDNLTDNNKSPGDDSTALREMTRNISHKFIGPVDTAGEITPVAGAQGAERVQNIDSLREKSSAGPMSQITLEVDGVNGDKQQITVDMRGNSVGANISTDAASADRMRARVGDLQGALEGHGLQVDTVHISSTPRPGDSAEQIKQVSSGDAIRLGGAASSGTSDGSFQQSQRERSTATRDWEDRQAAREEQRDSKKQQDRQRPQYQEKQ